MEMEKALQMSSDAITFVFFCFILSCFNMISNVSSRIWLEKIWLYNKSTCQRFVTCRIIIIIIKAIFFWFLLTQLAIYFHDD